MRTLPEARITRVHESAQHLAIKHFLIAGLRERSLTPAICEHLNADIVARIPIGGTMQTVAIEVECSDRNVLQNIERDFAQGGDTILIVCPDAATLASVARKVARSDAPQDNIHFTTPGTLALFGAKPISEPNPSEDKERHSHDDEP